MDSTIWYSCNYCKKVFSEKPQLFLHKKEKHWNEIKAKILSKNKHTNDVIVNEVSDDDHRDEHINEENLDSNDLKNVVVTLEQDEPQESFNDLFILENILTSTNNETIANVREEEEGSSIEYNHANDTVPTIVEINDIEVINLDSDTDDSSSVFVDSEMNNESRSSNDIFTVAIENSSAYQLPLSTSSSSAAATPGSLDLRKKRQSNSYHNNSVAQQDQPIDKFLWCHICMLPYTQLNTLKRHMQISHRIFDSSFKQRKQKQMKTSNKKIFYSARDLLSNQNHHSNTYGMNIMPTTQQRSDHRSNYRHNNNSYSMDTTISVAQLSYSVGELHNHNNYRNSQDTHVGESLENFQVCQTRNECNVI